MITLRPHTLKRWVKTSDGYYDENQDWHEGTFDWSESIGCRYEPNGKATTIALQDGSAYTYSYVVYLDLSVADFHYGDKVKIFDQSGNAITEKTVNGFHRGQLNARLWL